jgi:hypothetical protein
MTIQQPNSFRTGPDEAGHFGNYGGRFVAETLMPLILELEQAYADAKKDPAFQKEMDGYLKHYVGRPSALYFAERLTDHFGGAKIYFKREELNHTGAHKVNNVRGHPALGPGRDAELYVLRLQLAQGLQLRRRSDAHPAGGHDAAHHPVARQHVEQPQQPGPAQLGGLRATHHRRDGVLVGDVDVSR